MGDLKFRTSHSFTVLSAAQLAVTESGRKRDKRLCFFVFLLFKAPVIKIKMAYWRAREDGFRRGKNGQTRPRYPRRVHRRLMHQG
jgi:hypothetical protein